MINDIYFKIKNFFTNEQSIIAHDENIQNHDRFVKSKNIVIDHKTGLMWQDDKSIDNAVSWYEAVEIAKKCQIGGFNDWRIPSIDELKSIYDKNSYEKLNTIFEYRPFVLWTNMLDRDGYIATLFFDDHIVSEIIAEYTAPFLKNYFRLVRDINHEKIQNKDYKTNINTLNCNCKNWLMTRNNFPKNDPRRLCKHLIEKLDETNLPKEIFKYKHNILYYKSTNKGFRDDFNHLIEIPNTGCTLLYKYEFEWMSLFDENGNKYGFMIGGNGRFSWSKETKPASSKTIEAFFTNNQYLSPIELSSIEKHEIIKLISEKYKVVQENNHIYSSLAVIYDIVDENGDYRDTGSVVVTNENIVIKLHDNKKRNRLIINRDEQIIEKKLKERFLQINKFALNKEENEQIWDKNLENEQGYISFSDEQYKAKEIILSDYGKTGELLKQVNSTITTLRFHKILVEMQFLTKKRFYNNNSWILIGEGLKYGINYEVCLSQCSETPEWEVIFDYVTMTFKNEIKKNHKDFIYGSSVLWNKNKFQELLDLVIANVSIEKNQTPKMKVETKEKTVSKNKAERDEWLQNVETKMDTVSSTV